MKSEEKILLKIEHLSTTFPIKQTIIEKVQKKPEKTVQAVSDVSLEIHEGETLGLVGESGCGKAHWQKRFFIYANPQQGAFSLTGLVSWLMPINQ